MADQGSSSGDVFADEYEATLRAYVSRPSAEGLAAANALGQRALHAGYSMLELVAVHLEHRRKLVEDRGAGQLRDMDDFLTEALSSFEVTQRGFIESQKDAAAARDRAESLGLLTDMYLAIASHATLEARLEEVREQAKRFLAADDTRVDFGHRAEGGTAGRDSITVRLRGGGRVTVIAPAGRSWSDPDRMALKQFAVLVSAPVDDARRLQFSQRIGRLGRLLGGPLDPDEVIAKVVEGSADVIGASWTKVSPEGSDEEDSSDARFHSESTDDHTPTWAALPLAGADEHFGILVVGYDDAQPFDEVQRSFLHDVARRVTAALERSTAFARERASRHEAELASARLRHLQELATGLGRALTQRRAAELLLAQVLTSTSACGALVVVARPRPGSTEILAAGGPFSEGDDELLSALGPVLQFFGGDTGSEPARFTLADFPPQTRRHLESLGVRAINRYPMVARPLESTVLLVASSGSAGAAPADDELVRAQVGIAGPNLMRAERYDEEHDIADTLQRSMLAVPPLSMPGLRWAVYYRAGSARLAGGDWYDLVAIDNQRIGIAVGDIVGRGIEASASMGQLRSATRALASRVTDPAELLSELDNFASTTGHGRDSSVAYAVVDTGRRLINVSLAGHPPPVIRSPDRGTTLFEGGRGPLLGWGNRRESGVRRIEPGTQAVFYTDGLVERRDETLDVGLRRLVENVAALDETLPPAGVCEALIDRMALGGDETQRDDIAVVAVEFRGP